jgi:hypothetical protein
MIKGKHGKNDMTFEQLTFSEQSKSINGQISRLTASVQAHLHKAEQVNKNPNEILIKKLGQISRIINNLSK